MHAERQPSRTAARRTLHQRRADFGAGPYRSISILSLPSERCAARRSACVACINSLQRGLPKPCGSCHSSGHGFTGCGKKTTSCRFSPCRVDVQRTVVSLSFSPCFLESHAELLPRSCFYAGSSFSIRTKL